MSMWLVGIVGDDDGKLEQYARSALVGLPVSLEKYREGVVYDAAVLAEGAQTSATVHAAAAIIPGDSTALVEARCAVSYGMSGRDTVTISAAKHGCAVSLRRDIIGFGGQTVCRQDAVFPFVLPPEYALPIAAIALLCTG